MKTKIFHGNQYVKSITVDGKEGGGFKRFCRKVFILSMLCASIYSAWIARGVFAPVVKASEPIVNTVEVHFFPPALQRICNAEVTGNPKTSAYQFNKDGSVVRGKVNRSDIGYCMINEPIWNDKARALGYDIFTEKGNKDMALWLFENYAGQPWYLSEAMWGQK